MDFFWDNSKDTSLVGIHKQLKLITMVGLLEVYLRWCV